MPLRYLLDENQRGVLWHVIQRHNARGIDPIDTVRVGDTPDLPLGTDDPASSAGLSASSASWLPLTNLR